MATIRSSRARGRDEDAGEDRARLVARGRAGDLRDRLDERRGRDLDDRVAARLGQRREVLGAQRAQVERRGADDDLDVLLGGRSSSDTLRARAARGRRRAAAARGARPSPSRATSAVSGTRRPISMSVARSSTPAVAGGELDAGERLDGAARRGDARDGLQLREQIGARRRRASRWRPLEGRFRVIGAVECGRAARECRRMRGARSRSWTSCAESVSRAGRNRGRATARVEPLGQVADGS